MKTLWNSIQYAFTALGGWLGWMMGGFDGFLYALVVFVAIDYVTGFMCAILDRKLSSEIGAKGIFKKVVIFSLVAVGNIIDTNILGEGGVIRTAVIFFYMSNEGISILENATRLGLPVPEKLRTVLQQLNEGGDKDGN
jgi:toxin secretion/phage lysis holin